MSTASYRTIKGVRNKDGALVTYEFLLGKLLGKGAFAQCFEMKHQDRFYAGKVIQKSSLTKPNSKQKLEAEITNHKSLTHPHIVQFQTYFEDDECYYMIMELCNHRTLRSLLRRRKTLTEMETRYYLLQIISALKFIHSRGIIHQDLKLDNIFLKDMNVKIGDFGLSTDIKTLQSKKRTICGTPNYISPEVLTKSGHSFPSDIWAVGIIMYTLLIGRPPFETDDVEKTYQRIKDHNYSFPEDKTISPEAKSLIQAILSPNPDDRPTLTKITEHPFFKTYTPSHLPESTLNNAPTKQELLMHQRSIDRALKSHPAGRRPLTQTDPTRKALATIDTTTQNTPVKVEGKPSATPSKMTPTKYSTTVKGTENGSLKKPRALETQTKPGAQFTPPTKSVKVTSSENGHIVKKARLSDARGNEPRDTLCSPPNGMETCQVQTELSSFYTFLNNFTQPLTGSLIEQENEVTTYPIWLTKWIDYSEKYGLGYGLRDGTLGVAFNDRSMILSSPDQKTINYYHPPPAGKKNHRGIPICYTTEELDAVTAKDTVFTKRLTLLKNFTKYLINCKPSTGLDENLDSGPLDPNNLVYVVRWLKTADAIIFYLSNLTLQVNFFDHTKLVVSRFGDEKSNESAIITYVNKDGKRATAHIRAALLDCENLMGAPVTQVLHRLRYLRNCLVNL